MHTQGCQGCQKTRNFVTKSKILISRSSKIKNNLLFFKEFWCIFQWFLIFLNYGWMVDLAMSIFNFLAKFLVFWHPWHPWVCIHSDLKPLFETDEWFLLLCDITLLADKFKGRQRNQISCHLNHHNKSFGLEITEVKGSLRLNFEILISKIVM